MDRNLLLAFALSFLVLSLWSMTQEPRPRPEAEVEATAAAPTEIARAEEGAAGRYPELADPSTPTEGAPAPRAIPRDSTPAPAAVAAQTITVETAKYRAQLSTQGATLTRWRLLDELYADRFGDPIELVTPSAQDPTVTSPFLELGLGDLSRAVWNVTESARQVAFSITKNGVTVRKIYDFSEDDYDFRLRLEVDNGSTEVIGPAFLVEWPLEERNGNDFREQSAVALHRGEREQELLAGLGGRGFFGFFTGREEGEPVVFDKEVDWAGTQTPYFLSALFPEQPASASARFHPIEIGKRGVVQLYFDPVTLTPGQSAVREYRGYVGPMEVARLEAFSPTAVQAVDFGWSIIAPMTRFFAWALHVLYGIVGNYGWAIILLTVLVRVVTAPLTVKQMKSMERMRRIQPKMKEIQEKYADDRQKQSEAMMSLYRQEKVNPLGGCFPMLLQLPVFIGLFYALRVSIDLRHAHFIGWIDDLSAPDLLFTLPGIDFPVRVLPLLMGGSMFAQQKLMPTTSMDPAQAKMMLTVMPLMMTVISYTFPSGLVLYWMMSNVLAIAHQLWIGRNLEPAATN
ncbi:MAG: membrane protein insertase YidC [Myxococcota bacterium]